MEDIEDFESYKDLCKEQFENAQIKVLRLEQPPVEYLEKESRHILPEWPGRYLWLGVYCEKFTDDWVESKTKTFIRGRIWFR